MNEKKAKGLRRAMKLAKMSPRHTDYVEERHEYLTGKVSIQVLLNPYCGRAIYKDYKKKIEK